MWAIQKNGVWIESAWISCDSNRDLVMCFPQGRALLSRLQGLKAKGIQLKISSGMIDSTELDTLSKHSQLLLSLYDTFCMSAFKTVVTYLTVLSPSLSCSVHISLYLCFILIQFLSAFTPFLATHVTSFISVFIFLASFCLLLDLCFSLTPYFKVLRSTMWTWRRWPKATSSPRSGWSTGDISTSAVRAWTGDPWPLYPRSTTRHSTHKNTHTPLHTSIHTKTEAVAET